MKRKKKSTKPFVLIAIILIVIPLTLFAKYQRDIKIPADPSDDSVIYFQIERGASIKSIGQDLEEEGIIKSSRSFRVYIKRNEPDLKILAGRFPLKKSMTVPSIIKTISKPSKAEFAITIQEGLMIRDIDKRLVEMELTSPGEFKAAVKNFEDWERYDFLNRETLSKLDLPLEGYIYPDTYFLDPADFHPSELIYKALNNFEKKFASVRNEIKDKTYHEIITMASIVETEVFGEEDRKLVAGILWKRLRNNWRLDADATLLYIKDDRVITSADLQSDSPYNTRKFHGLPPGPVSNPSLESIKATITPIESEYWFYLNATKTGETIFAKTNDEHNRNRAIYL